MDRSAIKGPELLELNNSDADIRKSSSIMGRIYVEGYDTSLSGYDFIFSMKEHFASCGEVIHVYMPGYAGCLTLYRFALVYLRGGGAEAKALKLSGSYIGGRKIVVKPYSFRANHLDPELAPMREADNQRHHKILVRGYDTSLPLDYVEIMLMKHFSKCGGSILGVSIGEKTIGVLRSEAYIHVCGEDTIEKALQLCGCDWDGLENIEVYGVSYPAEEESQFYVMPSWCSSPRTSVMDATAAPEDPNLPKSWKALVDNRTGELYFWNPETNVSQFERPRSSARPMAPPAPVIFSASTIRYAPGDPNLVQYQIPKPSLAPPKPSWAQPYSGWRREEIQDSSTVNCYAPEDPNLPKSWIALVDGRTGGLYFWNPETNVSQYERPCSPCSAPPKPPAAPIIFSAIPKPHAGPVPSCASAVIYASEDPKLPKPWKTLVDSRNGFLYFWNPESNASQYERPPARPNPCAAPKISSAQVFHYGCNDPNLPKPWSSHVDGRTGYMYFWNPETSVSQYERPPSSAPCLSPPNAPVISRA